MKQSSHWILKFVLSSGHARSYSRVILTFAGFYPNLSQMEFDMPFSKQCCSAKRVCIDVINVSLFCKHITCTL